MLFWHFMQGRGACCCWESDCRLPPADVQAVGERHRGMSGSLASAVYTIVMGPWEQLLQCNGLPVSIALPHMEG